MRTDTVRGTSLYIESIESPVPSAWLPGARPAAGPGAAGLGGRAGCHPARCSGGRALCSTCAARFGAFSHRLLITGRLFRRGRTSLRVSVLLRVCLLGLRASQLPVASSASSCACRNAEPLSHRQNRMATKRQPGFRGRCSRSILGPAPSASSLARRRCWREGRCPAYSAPARRWRMAGPCRRCRSSGAAVRAAASPGPQQRLASCLHPCRMRLPLVTHPAVSEPLPFRSASILLR